MGLLDRLRDWWRSTFGGGADGIEGPVEVAGTFDYECTNCGTGVDSPDADCPLCRSSDIMATETGPKSATSTGGGSTRGPGGEFAAVGFRRDNTRSGRASNREADAAQTSEFGRRRLVRRHVGANDDAAVERLRDLRDDGDLLKRHADRWEHHAGGFRVETPTGTRIVDSREEVAALLRATDR